MSKSHGKRHGGKITRIVLGIDESYASFLDGAVKKGKPMRIGSNKGFSSKTPKLDYVEQPPGKEKVLMKDGVWQVPVGERPRNWEKIGGREKE